MYFVLPGTSCAHFSIYPPQPHLKFFKILYLLHSCNLITPVIKLLHVPQPNSKQHAKYQIFALAFEFQEPGVPVFAFFFLFLLLYYSFNQEPKCLQPKKIFENQYPHHHWSLSKLVFSVVPENVGAKTTLIKQTCSKFPSTWPSQRWPSPSHPRAPAADCSFLAPGMIPIHQKPGISSLGIKVP